MNSSIQTKLGWDQSIKLTAKISVISYGLQGQIEKAILAQFIGHFSACFNYNDTVILTYNKGS